MSKRKDRSPEWADWGMGMKTKLEDWLAQYPLSDKVAWTIGLSFFMGGAAGVIAGWHPLVWLVGIPALGAVLAVLGRWCMSEIKLQMLEHELARMRRELEKAA